MSVAGPREVDCPPVKPGAGRVSPWTGRFVDSEWEASYRESVRRRESTALLSVVVVVLIGIPAFIPSDYRLVADVGLRNAVLCARAAFGLATFALIPLALRARGWRWFEALQSVWLVGLLGVAWLATASRPHEYLGHQVLNVVVAFLVFSAFWVPTWVLTTVITVFAVGNLLLPGLTAIVGEPLWTTTVFGYVMSIGLGTVMNIRANAAPRAAFVALRQQSEARAELEHAMAEIRSLRGIIPICSHCHDVRDDTGYWQRVDQYVRAHTDVVFSHGICPACVREHYPELVNEREASGERETANGTTPG